MVMVVENSGFLKIRWESTGNGDNENDRKWREINALAQRSPQVAQALADGFLGGLLGGTIGAAKSAFNRNKDK
jgi:hypothetical protein